MRYWPQLKGRERQSVCIGAMQIQHTGTQDMACPRNGPWQVTATRCEGLSVVDIP